MTLTNKEKKILLEMKLKQLESEYYTASIDAEVAYDINNAQLVERSAEAMRDLKKAIKLIEEKLNELEGD